MTLSMLASVFVFLSSVSLSAEWVTISDRAAGVAEEDGAALTVTCEFENRDGAILRNGHGHIVIYFSEPRANWTDYSEVELAMISDDSSRTTARAHAVALSSTDVVINDVNSELLVMGKAKNSVTITAAEYTREFSALRLRETVSRVLETCGNHW
jgi:hypothetical protein